MGLTDWPADHYDCECHRYTVYSESYIWKMWGIAALIVAAGTGLMLTICGTIGC